MPDDARTAGWTTPDDVRERLLKRWTRGEFLRARAQGVPFEPLRVPLRGPSSSDLGDRLPEVREWVKVVRAGANRRGRQVYEIEQKRIGGRGFGRNDVPCRLVFPTLDQLAQFLGTTGEVAHYDAMLTLSRSRGRGAEWVEAHPRRALPLAATWPQLLDAVDWLAVNAGSDVYLRQIDVPGLDTKFVERNRKVILELLGDVAQQQEWGQTRDVARRLGLLSRPAFVRSRALDGTEWLVPGVSDLYLRVDEMAAITPPFDVVVIVENEINYLTLPSLPGVLALFGKGYDVERFAHLPWLAELPVLYWGDLDTHGFEILSRLRGHLPQTRSALMDVETLESHRELWGHEETPQHGPKLGLTGPELEAHDALWANAINGRPVRLEQERISYSLAVPTLTAALSALMAPSRHRRETRSG